METQSSEYAERLLSLESRWWKRVLPVQAPYRWNLRRQRLGQTLDVGCGVGRNLSALPAGSVGVDHNEVSVAVARRRGHTAWTSREFLDGRTSAPASFDALLVAHVIEHLSPEAARDLLLTYLEFVRPGGRVMLVCPQERGYSSDPTHETFTTGNDLLRLAASVGLGVTRWRSFPFHRRWGRLFVHNEFHVVATKPR